MLARGCKEPPTRAHAAASSLPAVRVILPAYAEAAMPEQSLGQTAETPPAPSAVAPVREVQQAPEMDKKVDLAERRKAEVEERLRRKKLAERRARREARIAVHRQEPRKAPTQQPAIVAFGPDDDQSSNGGSFFGN